jgi:hypothetical protein
MNGRWIISRLNGAEHKEIQWCKQDPKQIATQDTSYSQCPIILLEGKVKHLLING